MNEELPMGWRQSPTPIGDPSDAGTPEDEWEDVAYPRHARKELKFFYRGNRYVRICEILSDEVERKFVVHIGWMGKKSGDESNSSYQTLDEAVLKAKVLMRMGGYS